MIDLGCGSGRDAYFLAEQARLHGHAKNPLSNQHQQVKVLAIDNHGDALERTAALAARGGVDDILKCVRMDLRRPRVSKDLLEQQPKPSLVHAARFLERRLLAEWLTSPDAVAPGGYVIWSTFRDAEEEKGERNAAPPFATSRRLRRGELGEYFRVLGGRGGEGLYDVLHEEEGGQLATRGMAVPASFVVARRRK
jgi:SAM-dependent methyltransferase